MSKKISETRLGIQRDIDQIRTQIEAIDLICPGTLLKRTKVCGKPTCRCAQDPKARHGPYYEWSRWVKGRLVHSVVPPWQAKELARGIRNNRAIRRLLDAWSRKSVEAIRAQKEPKFRD